MPKHGCVYCIKANKRKINNQMRKPYSHNQLKNLHRNASNNSDVIVGSKFISSVYEACRKLANFTLLLGRFRFCTCTKLTHIAQCITKQRVVSECYLNLSLNVSSLSLRIVLLLRNNLSSVRFYGN